MSTTHEPLFARASRTWAPENADYERPLVPSLSIR
jgi:hypothetical protein